MNGLVFIFAKKLWIFALILIVIISFIVHRNCIKQKQVETDVPYIQEKVYREPIVRLPFTKNRQPIKDSDLPIPKKDIDKIIVIEGGAKIVIDKKGKIYRSKDTPQDIRIDVTRWQPKFLDFETKFGYALIFSKETYHCISIDLFRIWKVHIGPEVGALNSRWEPKWFLGVSGKYRFGGLDLFGLKANFLALAGWSFTEKNFYGGLSLKF